MINNICDVCRKPATRTVEVYIHQPGFRNLFGLHMPRAQGQMVDLCDTHAQPIMAMLPHGRNGGDGDVMSEVSKPQKKQKYWVMRERLALQPEQPDGVSWMSAYCLDVGLLLRDLDSLEEQYAEQLETLREALRWIEANEAGEPHAAAIAHDALNPASDYEQASLDTFGADSAPASGLDS